MSWWFLRSKSDKLAKLSFLILITPDLIKSSKLILGYLDFNRGSKSFSKKFGSVPKEIAVPERI